VTITGPSISRILAPYDQMKFLCTVCSLFLYSVSVNAQAPCSSKDAGPFLATLPTLTMDIFEATEQDLIASPESYRSELRLYGEVNGMGADGIVLEVMPDYAFFNPEDTFRFASHNGVNYVELYKQIDRDGPTAALDDDTNVFGFTLKCSLQSNMSDYVLYDAKIFVLDVNDNDPEFGNLTDTLTINELTPVDMSVLPVRATDKDLNDDMSGHFAMDAETGDLIVMSPLDYETQSEGTLVIAVSDNGTPARTATATLQVRIEDGDDQGPVFVYPGCWQHRGRCAWPKYTASTVLKKGEPIAVFPVPNKVKANVPIKARDLDATNNPVSFSIASTIPPGSESMFTVSTSQTGSGEYQAVITPTQDMNVHHGFEIFLQVEEHSDSRRFEVAMIFFEVGRKQHVCIIIRTNEPVIALIVVVAILAAFILCLAIAFFCVLRKSGSRKSDDVTL
ncbi:hypothetical protein BaRGS_00016934, partial [Batillaria attramentaria]